MIHHNNISGDKAMTTIKVLIVAGCLLASTPLFADCPDGGRTTSAAERQVYVEMVTTMRTQLPAAPAGWRLLDRNPASIVAPDNVCKGSALVAGYFVTYIWTDQEKRAAESDNKKSARIRALLLLTPEEQKQVDDLTRQARVFERQAVAVIRTDPDEAARLRAKAQPFSDEVRKIREAHLEAILPQRQAIEKEEVPGVTGVGTQVTVSISANKDRETPSPKAERASIAGAADAIYDGNDLIMSIGRDAAGRNIIVRLTGTRRETAAIANLFISSGLSSLASKQ
jgi:hypothetical protein